jgi:hypothetical protein
VFGSYPDQSSLCPIALADPLGHSLLVFRSNATGSARRSVRRHSWCAEAAQKRRFRRLTDGCLLFLCADQNGHDRPQHSMSGSASPPRRSLGVARKTWGSAGPAEITAPADFGGKVRGSGEGCACGWVDIDQSSLAQKSHHKMKRDSRPTQQLLRLTVMHIHARRLNRTFLHMKGVTLLSIPARHCPRTRICAQLSP